MRMCFKTSIAEYVFYIFYDYLERLFIHIYTLFPSLNFK